MPTARFSRALGWVPYKTAVPAMGMSTTLYWRFDFDIDTPAPNRILETFGHDFNAFAIPFESKRYRNVKLAHETWIVDNPKTGDSYKIVSGATMARPMATHTRGAIFGSWPTARQRWTMPQCTPTPRPTLMLSSAIKNSTTVMW